MSIPLVRQQGKHFVLAHAATVGFQLAAVLRISTIVELWVRAAASLDDALETQKHRAKKR
jgi:hypothetical protein